MMLRLMSEMIAALFERTVRREAFANLPPRNPKLNEYSWMTRFSALAEPRVSPCLPPCSRRFELRTTF